MMQRLVLVWALAGALVASGAETAVGQSGALRRAAIGGALGIGGGSVATLAVIVARARFQSKYLDSPEDLVHWQTLPAIAGPVSGVVFGVAGDRVLWGSVIGSTSGLVAGAAVGAGLGAVLSDDPEWTWGGGVIGAGVGVSVGALVGAFVGWQETDDSERVSTSSIPISVRIPL